MFLEILGVITGIIYLWLEYRASIYQWIAGIIMPAIYIFVYYNAGLYADFGINIYYLLIALYGWVAWKTGFTLFGSKEPKKELPIIHAPRRAWIKTTVAFIVALLAIKFFIGFVTKYGFKVFGWYRILVGGLILALLFTGHNLTIA